MILLLNKHYSRTGYSPGELQNLVKNDNFTAINDDLSKCVDEFWNIEFKHLKKEY